jgi:hypothetical protein
MEMKNNMPKILKEGTRVRVLSLDIKGKIFYIDYRMISYPHTYPVQIELDKPYDESGQTMYRTNFWDLKKLIKKKVKK